MKRQWPNVETVGVYSPPMGFERDPDESNYMLGRIALCRPDVVVVGLGAPKQELWVHQNRDQIQAKVALCVGATIDFLAGEKRRAPVWMRQAGIEWLHRMCSDPRRLVKRYAKDAWVFPQLVWQQLGTAETDFAVGHSFAPKSSCQCLTSGNASALSCQNGCKLPRQNCSRCPRPCRSIRDILQEIFDLESSEDLRLPLAMCGPRWKQLQTRKPLPTDSG